MYKEKGGGGWGEEFKICLGKFVACCLPGDKNGRKMVESGWHIFWELLYYLFLCYTNYSVIGLQLVDNVNLSWFVSMLNIFLRKWSLVKVDGAD